MLATATVVFAFVMVTLFLAMARNGDREPPRWARGSPFLIGAGIVMPTVVVAVLAVLTFMSMNSLAQTQADPLRVRVVGHQFWWEVSYVDEGIVTANEIHLPVGRDVELELVSDNVIHAFWVPALDGKIDMVPGRENRVAWRAEEAGTYLGFCAEYCGLQHATMRFVAVALEAEDFDRWVIERREAVEERAGDAARFTSGLGVFLGAGCAQCHAIRGTAADGVVGPDLTHLGTRETIGAGIRSNTADELRRWIEDPHDVKRGVNMPAFGDLLSADELDTLVAYLQELD
jgi:cytochrome c oxidase subunit II